MDNLFRKAVDNYTLQPGESNWETIVLQLSADDNAVTATKLNRKNNTAINGIFLLVLLLIPLSTAMFSFYYTGRISARTGSATTMPLHMLEGQAVDHNFPAHNKQITIMYAADKVQNSNAVKSKISNTETVKNRQLLAPAALITNIGGKRKNKIDVNYPVSNAILARESVGVISSNQQINTGNKEQPIAPKITSWRKHRMYAGVISGITFNEVKRQGFKKPGFDIGIIAGYKIGRNTSVEAGLVYSKKYYFSNGKYFSMDKMEGSMPAEMKILTIEGSSNLYQLPLAVKYDIVHKKESAVFASAGISSYLLTKEKNDYQVSMNGVQQNMKGMYKHVSGGFASSVNISFGYQRTLQQATVSIRPYLQIPLKGMGMGSMQVMSTGVHVVYTR